MHSSTDLPAFPDFGIDALFSNYLRGTPLSKAGSESLCYKIIFTVSLEKRDDPLFLMELAPNGMGSIKAGA